MSVRRQASGSLGLIVVLLPLFVVLWLGDRLMIERERAAVRALESRMDADLNTLVLTTQPRQILRRHFATLFAELAQQNFSRAGITAARRRPPALLNAEVVGFTPDGAMVVPPWSRCSARFVMQKLWKEIGIGHTDDKTAKMYRAVFGPTWTINDADDNPGFPYPIGIGPADGGFIWQRGPDRSGLIMHCPIYPNAWTCITQALSRTRAAGFTGVYSPESGSAFGHGPSWPYWQGDIARAAAGGGGSIVAGDHLCRVVRDPSGLWLLRAQPLANVQQTHWRWLWALVGGGFALTVAGSWWHRSETTTARLGVGRRLTSLLLLSAAIPLILLISLALGSLRERAAVLEREVADRTVARLRTLDSRFTRHHKKLERLWYRVTRHPATLTGDQKALDEIQRRLDERHWMGRLDIRGLAGTPLWSTDKDASTINQMMEPFAKGVYRRYLGVEPHGGSDPLGAITTKILTSPRLGLSGVFDLPETTLVMAVGDRFSDWWWSVREPTPGCPAAFISINLERVDLIADFVNHAIPSGTWIYTERLDRWAPTPPARLEASTQLVARALLGRQTAHRDARRAGERILMLAFPSNVLTGYCYYTTARLTDVDRTVAAFRDGLLFGAALTLALTLLFGSLLSRAILGPIAELRTGVSALEARQFDFRLPDLGGDELGLLGVAFNAMTAEMRRVDLGREVQIGLIPSVVPRIPGYSLALSYWPASDLGGDYVDLLPRPDGRLLVVIGDVAGHGIGAALLTAMAKTVCHESARENLSLGRLFERLNHLINKGTRSRKLMTMAAALLDPRSHRLECVCAGHPYPLVRRPDGSVIEVGAPQYPLGSRSKATWRVDEVSLEPGAAMLWYTDGIVEGQDAAGRMFDHPGLRGSLGRADFETATGMHDDVLLTFRNHIGTVPPGDDITLAVVRRDNT